MIPLASDLLIRFRSQMRREGLLVSASSPTGFCHSVALGVSTLTFIDVQRSWRPQCKESLAVANKPQSRSAVVPRIAISACDAVDGSSKPRASAMDLGAVADPWCARASLGRVRGKQDPRSRWLGKLPGTAAPQYLGRFQQKRPYRLQRADLVQGTLRLWVRRADGMRIRIGRRARSSAPARRDC